MTLILHRIYKYCFYRLDGFTPGPPRFPVFGSYLLLLIIIHKNLHLAIKKLCKFYNCWVIGYHVADSLTVIANDQKTIREILFNPDFDGRNDFFIGRLREADFNLKRIFLTDGGYWIDQNRYTLRNLRDFGFGRRYQGYEYKVCDSQGPR